MDLINIVLVDDHNVVRRGLKSLFSAYPDIAVIGEAESGESALVLLQTAQPNVVVTDLLMPGGMSGIELTKQVREQYPDVQVVALTAYTDDARVVAALRAGALGYMRKDADLDLLVEAVRAASRGQSMVDPSMAAVVLRDLVTGSNAVDELTGRETTVLQQLARGKTNKEIAVALNISLETVKTHVANILGKLQQDHRMKAVIVALKRGLVSLDDLEV